MRRLFRSARLFKSDRKTSPVEASPVVGSPGPVRDAAAAHWDGVYTSVTRSAWTQNSQVASAIQQRMTDQPGLWLSWLFNEALPPIERMLSIGCGDGVHENLIARFGMAQSIVAFDGSQVAIERARAEAEAGGWAVDFSVRLFEEFAAEPGPENTFDLVLFSGSLHHVKDLEGMLSAVRRVLKPGGKVVVNEYCGACYQIYPQSQVDVVNRVLNSIPAEFRAADVLEVPTIDMVMAADPTEGVRSALIPQLVNAYFEAEYERFLGGGLLHPLFTCLNATRVNDGSPESRILVDMLIGMDDELTRSGALGHDFMFGIYHRRH